MVVYLQCTDLPLSSGFFGRSIPPQCKYEPSRAGHSSLRATAAGCEAPGTRNPGRQERAACNWSNFEVHRHTVLLCSLKDLPIEIQGHSRGSHPPSHVPLEFGV
eukprot:1325789-Rhodomonas_salina.2